MIYGLYHSAQGADIESLRQDVISNNLANASTNGFKRDLAVFQAHQPLEIEQGQARELPGNLNAHSGGLSVAEVVTDFSNGALQKTGAPLDLALTGLGFFHVSDGQNDYLTRNGQFSINNVGELVTQAEGHQVLSTNGNPIVISPNATNVLVGPDGNVMQIVNGAAVEAGRLDVVLTESPRQLQKIGNSLYQTDADLIPADDGTHVNQGYLEASGTRPVLEMTDLIGASRAFESNINMIKFQDEALGRLLQTMPSR